MPGTASPEFGLLSGLPSSLSRLLHPEEAISEATTVCISAICVIFGESLFGKQEGYHKSGKHFEQQFASLSNIIKCTAPMHKCTLALL